MLVEGRKAGVICAQESGCLLLLSFYFSSIFAAVVRGDRTITTDFLAEYWLVSLLVFLVVLRAQEEFSQRVYNINIYHHLSNLAAAAVTCYTSRREGSLTRRQQQRPCHCLKKERGEIVEKCADS
jgi:hypothetical protein